MESRDKLLFLSGGFIVALAISNIIATKRIMICGEPLPAGIIAYPLTFLLSDVIAEVWGMKTARTIVWVGFAANIVMVLFLYLGKILPSDPSWINQEAYETILGGVPRIVAASMIAYLISQHHDIWVFHFWRQKANSRFLWWRNNASTMVSQALDTGIFISLAFYGQVPSGVLMEMIVAQYIAKLLFALADTPFCYLLVGWARGRIEMEPGRLVGDSTLVS